MSVSPRSARTVTTTMPSDLLRIADRRQQLNALLDLADAMKERPTADVIDGRSSIVWERAADRLPTEQATLRYSSAALIDPAN